MKEKDRNENILEVSTIDDLLANPFGEEVLVKKEPLQNEQQKPVRLIDVIPEENRQKA